MNDLPLKNKAFFLSDIITQAILIGVTLIGMLSSGSSGSAFFILMLMLIPIGGFQMLSAAIHLFNGKQFPKIRSLRNVHFWGGAMYLALVFFWIGPMGWIGGEGLRAFFEMTIRAIPVVFAVGYFLLTVWDYRTHNV